MHFFRFAPLRRGLCALCALSLVLGVLLPPAARAEGPDADADSAGELTVAQARAMGEADEALAELTSSPEYAALTPDAQADAAADRLDDLADQALIRADSIYYDAENRMYTFTYACGVWGGLMLDQPADDSEQFALPLTEQGLDALAGTNDTLASAIIYYAFDDTVNSTRYPYYVQMAGFWNEVGLDTTLDSDVTVRDMRRMNNYDLCILSAHGAYYTYSYRYAFFWEKVESAPIIILMEESNLWKDLLYSIDLLCHRVIKINGQYCLLPSFFTANYPFGQLEGTIVFSETCDFLGFEPYIDFSLSEALLNAGADAVVGYVNTVYTIYSRNLVWATVNQLIMGRTIQESLQYAISVYGTDDVSWYLSQGGLMPHSPTAYPVLGGDRTASLYSLSGYFAPTLSSPDEAESEEGAA